jgi:hypothetical protein
MTYKTSQQERGQILVILVLALVGLLAFTALAVDVGMVFADRRYDQNVADSISLAGSAAASKTMISAFRSHPDLIKNSLDCNVGAGYNFVTYIPPENNWQDQWVEVAMHDAYVAAQARAKINDYNNPLPAKYSDEDFNSSDQGVFIKCVPGSSETAGFYTYAKVSSTTQSSFAHFVFGGPLKNTVEAVSLVTIITPAGSGNAVLAECHHTNDGLFYDGNVDVITVDSTQRSNCDMKNTSNATIVRAVDEENNCLQNGIMYSGSGDPGNANSCTAVQVPDKEAMPPVASVTCPDIVPNPKFNTPPYYLSPGTYTDINVTLKSDETLFIEPGLYCFDNTKSSQGAAASFTITGGNIVSVDSAGNPVPTPDGCKDISGCGSTFWVVSGNVNIVGNGQSVLAAPANYPDDSATGGAIAGLLFGAPLNYYGTVNIEGTKGDTFMGTLFIPDGTISIGGNKDINGDLTGPSLTTSIIADSIKFHGIAGVSIDYDQDMLYLTGGLLDLRK